MAKQARRRREITAKSRRKRRFGCGPTGEIAPRCCLLPLRLTIWISDVARNFSVPANISECPAHRVECFAGSRQGFPINAVAFKAAEAKAGMTTQYAQGVASHRPRIGEVFTEHLPSGDCGFIVADVTVNEGIITDFEAGPYPQGKVLVLYKFKLGPDGEWLDLALGAREPPMVTWGLPWQRKAVSCLSRRKTPGQVPLRATPRGGRQPNPGSPTSPPQTLRPKPPAASANK